MKLSASLVLIGALALGVAACGSSSSGAATAASGAATSTVATRYQARLALAKCLRAHGLNVPDPSPNGGVAGGGGLELRALRDSPNFRTAMQACAKYRAAAFPFRNLTPAERAQRQQDLVKFAQCMRSHGIDIPDPTTGTGGGLGIFRQITPSERDSPAFQSALQACSTNLPFRRPRAAGAAPAAPAGNPGA
jgi:hypothetical protein